MNDGVSGSMMKRIQWQVGPITAFSLRVYALPDPLTIIGLDSRKTVQADFASGAPAPWRPAAAPQGRAARGRRAGGWGEAAAARGEKGLWNSYPPGA